MITPCPECKQDLNSASPSCRHPKRHVSQMTPPDSGEREVCGSVFVGLSGTRYSCNLEAGHVGPHVRVDPLGQRAVPEVALPLSLAQRILAALEDPDAPDNFDLVNELRARMPR